MEYGLNNLTNENLALVILYYIITHKYLLLLILLDIYYIAYATQSINFGRNKLPL